VSSWRTGEQLTVEVEGSREQGHVEEVLHPDVGHAELRHRLELLRDDGLSRAGAQTRRREVEERRAAGTRRRLPPA
jgi:hypothetical protein